MTNGRADGAATPPLHTVVVESAPDGGGWLVRDRALYSRQRDAIEAARHVLASTGGGRLEVITRGDRVRIDTIPAGHLSGASSATARESLRATWSRMHIGAKLAALLGIPVLLASAVSGAEGLGNRVVAEVERWTGLSGPSAASSRELGVQILQDGAVVRQFAASSVFFPELDMDREPFSLRFRGTDGERARICASRDLAVLAQIPETDPSAALREGGAGKQAACLDEAARLDRNTFDTHLELSLSGHNMFFPQAFQSVDGGQEVQVSVLREEGRGYSELAEFSGNLHLRIWVDKDENGHIDDGEYDDLILEF